LTVIKITGSSSKQFPPMNNSECLCFIGIYMVKNSSCFKNNYLRHDTDIEQDEAEDS
jgi:hypothetical protein